MNKIIRTPRISEQPVRISVRGDAVAPPEEEAEEGAFAPLDDRAEAVDPSEIAEDEGEVQDAEGETDSPSEEGASGELEEQPPPEEEAEETPTVSALDLEAMVEERLKEFEDRFQKEKEEAYRAGFEDGRTEGLKEGQEQSGAEIDRFRSILKDLEAQWKDLFKNADLSLAELALAVARRIIGSAVEVRPEPVRQTVGECLTYLQDKSRLVIKVHPDDLEVVRRHRNDWLESLEGIEQLIIEGDPAIARGGCIVETPVGDVDAQIEERLERLRVALVEEIRRGDETA